MILGCKKDHTDTRDYLMRAYLPIGRLPVKVDYTSKMSPVKNQGTEGTCVGFASIIGMKEYQEKLDYKRYIGLSPRFVYSECKKLDKMPGEGTTIRAAMKVLKKLGVCEEVYWPYRPFQSDRAKSGARANAKTNKILTYARIVDLYELKAALVQKGPCVIGVKVFRGMMETKTGLVPLPKRGERMLGGHAICPVGYDDNKGRIKFKNSWSASWGDKGFGYLGYDYLESFMMDAWSSVDITDANPLTISSILKIAK